MTPPHTVVSFHAHPDDEALYTSGTLAKAVADGHRVVLVVATAGESGLASTSLPGDQPLGDRRLDELTASAREIGCSRVVLLGYGDSGFDGTANPERQPFASADVEEAAATLAKILVEERADALTTYDAAGGYGHADHKQVHRVGALAATLAATPIVLEATADRDVLRRVVRLLRALHWVLPGLVLPSAETAYTARRDITHRIDICAQLAVKRAAIAAHVSQSTAPSGVRTLWLILKLPRPVFARAFRYEWFVERGRAPSEQPLGDIFATLD
ncbi:MAG: PIG-L deacetylase family protein [Nocardioidaceae bacterium]